MRPDPDVLIVGGGLGGVSAALAALQGGLSVTIVESTRWIGGQLTSQMVPFDDHLRVESFGASTSYRRLRRGIREYYRRWYPLSPAARQHDLLNPGASWVGPLAHEPRVGVAVLESLLAPYRACGRLSIELEHEVKKVVVEDDHIRVVAVRSNEDGAERWLRPRWVVDATDLGDVLDIADVEWVSGRESTFETGEPGAPENADPLDMQAVTWCFAVDHVAGEDHVIDRPEMYNFFREWRPAAWGGRRLLSFGRDANEIGDEASYAFDVNADSDPLAIANDHRRLPSRIDLWSYRRIAARRQFKEGIYASDITVVNWPLNDYVGGPIFGVPDADEHRRRARQLSLSTLYWLQTEAPRPDGGTGWPGLRLRRDIAGTADGLAMAPYVREARRIRARYTVVEQDISSDIRGDLGSRQYWDSVGIGHYYWIDVHAGTGGTPGRSGVPHPFEIPLGALIPVRMQNLLPAGKNIGTTHITNGCYRLHPVEWSIGEAVGHLLTVCADEGKRPHQVYESPRLVEGLQRRLMDSGVPLHWPAEYRLG